MKRSEFEITDKKIIEDVLIEAEYGTLALCKENKPYSVPINFVYIDGAFYFHGSKSGKKIEYIKSNPNASLSVVLPYSMIQSYFSSNEGLACPATQFFKSVSIDGEIKFIKDYEEKIIILEALMKKLQPEGKYKALSDDAHLKVINATEIFKLTPKEVKAKFKLGQHLPKERFNMIIEHLETRGSEIDKLSAIEMRKFSQLKV